MNRWLRRGGVILLAFVALAQFVPVDRANPPIEGEVPAPPAVRAVLERACFDCHSNQTRWPWYAYVAPVSWLVARDVEEGREHLNFQAWARYDGKRRAHKIKEVWEEVEEGEMPLWFYLPLHPEAKLSEADRQVLRAWSATEGEREDGGDHDDEGGHDGY